LASAFESFGFRELYVADLDAIMRKGDNLDILWTIVEKTGLKLMVDFGVSDLESAEKVFGTSVSKIIVGTETLPDLGFLKEVLQRFGNDKIVVSLDLKNGQVLSKSASVAAMDSWSFGFELQNLGIREMIVLDLARVGSEKGVDLSLLKNMAKAFSINVGVGGGVRDLNDLKTLENLGIYEVLLATALHSGKISVEDLKRSGFLT
jgi:phosphoribosylformimino-5-aminoimidazole carboxamide ribotide isomerase